MHIDQPEEDSNIIAKPLPDQEYWYGHYYSSKYGELLVSADFVVCLYQPDDITNYEYVTRMSKLYQGLYRRHEQEYLYIKVNTDEMTIECKVECKPVKVTSNGEERIIEASSGMLRAQLEWDRENPDIITGEYQLDDPADHGIITLYRGYQELKPRGIFRTVSSWIGSWF